jgi:hypothetical protein
MVVSCSTLSSACRPDVIRPTFESTRTTASRSPMEASTVWALSYAVVAAPMATSRPGEGLPTAGADVALPGAVVDLAESLQHQCHRQHAAGRLITRSVDATGKL